MVDGSANAVSRCLLGNVVAICRRHVRQGYCKNAGEADLVDESDFDAKPASVEYGTCGLERSYGKR